MKKLLMFLIFSLAFGWSYSTSQTTEDVNRLRPNVNQRANELKHYLNKNGDSLILECDGPIYSVQFINGEFSETLEINKNTTAIYINDLPYGKFTVAVTIRRKIIVFNLYRDMDSSDIINYRRDREDGVGLSEEPDAGLQSVGRNAVSVIKEISIIGIDTEEDEPEAEKVKPVFTTPNRFFWVREHVNLNLGGSTLYRVVDEETKDRIIAKNKIDLNSKHGRGNQLTVWELYDVTGFTKARNGRVSPEGISERFVNPKPIYDSSK
jgi:hypothetical protein